MAQGNQLEFLLAYNSEAANGTVTVYEANSTTLADVYSDVGVISTAANPYTLSTRGTAKLYVKSGVYKVDVKDSNNVSLNGFPRDYLVYGIGGAPWIDSASYASLNAAITAIGSTETTLKVTSDTTMTGNCTIPATCAVEVMKGATIDNSTYTLTVNNPQDFDLSWVADNTGVADATDSINNLTVAGRLVGGGTYLISDKVVIKGNADLGRATFNVDGAPTIAVEVSTGDAADPTTELIGVDIVLPKIINLDEPTTGWVGQGTGVRVVNLINSFVKIPRIRGFDVGLFLTGNNTNGTAQNEFYIGHLDNNKVNLKIEQLDTTGWVNENNFYGGEYSHDSAEGTDVSGTRHIQILLYSGNTNEPNNNVFHKPSLEGNVSEYHFECQGVDNLILSGRWEASTPKVHYINTSTAGTQGSNNIIMYGYFAFNIVTTQDSGCLHNHIYDRDYLKAEQSFHLSNVSSSTTPVIYVFEAGTSPLTATPADDYSGAMSSQALRGKRKADTLDRVKVDFVNGRLYLSNGSTALAEYYGVIAGVGLTAMGGAFGIPDGITAPSTVSGYAWIYVDGSDGDLKVKFGDGTVKTIATDT